MIKDDQLQPDFTTLAAYHRDTEGLAAGFDTSDRSFLHSRLTEIFSKPCRLLELGSGSGVDAAFMLDQEFDITASDGSSTMLKHLASRYPSLSSRLAEIVLPNRIPFGDAEFDGVIGIAVLQHLSLQAIADSILEVSRVLRKGGILYTWMFDSRIDLDDAQRDPKGRLMTLMSPEAISQMLEHASLTLISTQIVDDLIKRPGIQSREYVCQKC